MFLFSVGFDGIYGSLLGAKSLGSIHFKVGHSQKSRFVNLVTSVAQVDVNFFHAVLSPE